MSMNSVNVVNGIESKIPNIRVVTPHRIEKNYSIISSTEEDDNEAFEVPGVVNEIISLSASTSFEGFENDSQRIGNNTISNNPIHFCPDKNAAYEYFDNSNNTAGSICYETPTQESQTIKEIKKGDIFTHKKCLPDCQKNFINDVVPSASTETLIPVSSTAPIPILMQKSILQISNQIPNPTDHIVEINSDSTTQSQRQKRRQMTNNYHMNSTQTQQRENQQKSPEEKNKVHKSATYTTITTATMHKNDCSTESSSELPLSSPSNPPKLNAGGNKIGDKYKNLPPLLKNTLPADSLERQLAMINTYNPQMSLTERIQLWQCEQNVSDVEDVTTFDDDYKRFEQHKKQLMEHFGNYKHFNIEKELHQIECQTMYRQNSTGCFNTNDLRKYEYGISDQTRSLDTKLYVMAQNRSQNYYNSSESEECREHDQIINEKPSTSALALQRRRLRIQSALPRSGLERLEGPNRHRTRHNKTTLKKHLDSTTPPSSSSSDVVLSYISGNNDNKCVDNRTDVQKSNNLKNKCTQQQVEVYDKVLCRSSSEEEQQSQVEATTVPLLENEKENSLETTSRSVTMQSHPVEVTTQHCNRLNHLTECENAREGAKEHQHLDTSGNFTHKINNNQNHGYNDDKKNDKELFKDPLTPKMYTTKTSPSVSEPSSVSASVSAVPLTTPSVMCLTNNQQIQGATEPLNICESTNSKNSATKIVKRDEITIKDENYKDKMFKESTSNAIGNSDGSNGGYHQQCEFYNYLGLTGTSTAAAMASAVAELAQCNLTRRSMRVLRQQHKERQEINNKSRRDLEDLKIKQLKEIKKREKGGQDIVNSSELQRHTERSEPMEQIPLDSTTPSRRTSDVKSSPVTLVNGRTLLNTPITVLKKESDIKILCHLNASSKEEAAIKSKECVNEIVQPIKDKIKQRLTELKKKFFGENFESDNNSKSSDNLADTSIEMPSTSKKVFEVLPLQNSPPMNRLRKPLSDSCSAVEKCTKVKSKQKYKPLSQLSPQSKINTPSKSTSIQSEVVGDTLDNISKGIIHSSSILQNASSEDIESNNSASSNFTRLQLFDHVQTALMESRKLEPKVCIIKSIDYSCCSSVNDINEKSTKPVQITSNIQSQNEDSNNKEKCDNQKKEFDNNEQSDNDDDMLEVSYSPTPPIYSPINTPVTKVEIRKQHLKSPFTTNSNSIYINNNKMNGQKMSSFKKSRMEALNVNTRSRKMINRLTSFKRLKKQKCKKSTSIIILKTMKSTIQKIEQIKSECKAKGSANNTVKDSLAKIEKNQKVFQNTETNNKMKSNVLLTTDSINHHSHNHQQLSINDNAASSSPIITVSKMSDSDDNIINSHHVETETRNLVQYSQQQQQQPQQQQKQQMKREEQLPEKQKQQRQQHQRQQAKRNQLDKLKGRRFAATVAKTSMPTSPPSKIILNKLNLKRRTKTQITPINAIHTNATFNVNEHQLDVPKRKKYTTQNSIIEQVKDEHINNQDIDNYLTASPTTITYNQTTPTPIINNITDLSGPLTPTINSSEVRTSELYVIPRAPIIETKDQATQSSLSSSIRYLNVYSLQQQQHKQIELIDQRHSKYLNGMRNPLKNDFGKVLHIYYELDVLIVIQELLVSFWKSSQLLNILTTRSSSSLSIPMKSITPTTNGHHSHHNSHHYNENNLWMNALDELAPSTTLETKYMAEWLLLGELRYLSFDYEISATYANRICVHNSIPIYVEMRGRPLPQNQRECHLLCMYVNIYYYSTEENLPKFASIHLDSIQSDITKVNYTTITNSRYFIMSWPKEKHLNKTRSGLCKYSLTPQLDTLASIRPFNSVRHIIHYMECMKDDKLIGFGDKQITIWDHCSGNVLMNYELDISLGKNLASIYYHSRDLAQMQYGATGNVLILYQYRHFIKGTPPELLILACNISHTMPSYTILHQYLLPENEIKSLKGSTTTDDHIILTTENDQEIWISCSNPNIMVYVPTTTSNDSSNSYNRRFYSRYRNNVIQFNEKILNVDNLTNLLLKSAASLSNT